MKLMVLRRNPIIGSIYGWINISHAVKSGLPMFKELLALFIISLLESEHSNLHLNVKDRFIYPVLTSSSKLFNDAIKIVNSSLLLGILPRNYNSEMGKLQKIDVRLKISDEVMI